LALVKRLPPTIMALKLSFELFISTARNNCLTFEFAAQYAPLLTDGFVFSQRLSTLALMDLSSGERAT
jgi:hypothetical protein